MYYFLFFDTDGTEYEGTADCLPCTVRFLFFQPNISWFEIFDANTGDMVASADSCIEELDAYTENTYERYARACNG